MTFADAQALHRRAMAAALAMIARRDHTRRELMQKLLARGFDGDTCEAVLERCRELGYLDDDRTARAMVVALRRRGLGIHRIRARLRDKGIDGGTVDALTVPDADPDLAMAAARKACEGKQAALKRENDPVRRRAKLYRFLLSRGFPADVIRRLIEEI